MSESFKCKHENCKETARGANPDLCLFHAPEKNEADASEFKRLVDERIEAEYAAYERERLPELSEEKVRAAALIGARTDFAGYRFPKGYVFPRTRIVNLLFCKAVFEGDVWLNMATVRGDISLDGAKVQGDVRLISTTVQGDISLYGAKVQGDVKLDWATMQGSVRLDGATVQGNVLLDWATVRGNVWMNGATCEKDLSINNVHAMGRLVFSRCKVRGNLFLDGSRFGGADFSYADIEGRASFADVVFFPGAEVVLKVSFIGTHFARGADFIGTRFLVPTRFRNMNLAPLRFDNVWLGLVSLVKCRLDGALFANCRFLEGLEGRWPLKSRYSLLLDCTLNANNPHTIKTPDSLADANVRAIVKAGGKLETKEIGIFSAPDKKHLEWTPAEIKARLEWKAGYKEILDLYQVMKKNLEGSGNPVEAGDFYFGEMELKRRERRRALNNTAARFTRPLERIARLRALAKRVLFAVLSFVSWFRLHNLYRVFSGYGERPLRAFVWSFGVLPLVFAFFYSFAGIALQPVDIPHARVIEYEMPLPDAIRHVADFVFKPVACAFRSDFAAAWLFALQNIVPFVNRSGSSVVPANRASQSIVMLEQFLGTVFISMFLLALRRRFKR